MVLQRLETTETSLIRKEDNSTQEGLAAEKWIQYMSVFSGSIEQKVTEG